MAIEKKRPSSIAFLLVGLILLVSGAGLVAFLPLVKCPVIDDDPRFGECALCRGSGRITLLKKWQLKPGSLPEWEGKDVTTIVMEGFFKTSKTQMLDRLSIRKGQQITSKKMDETFRILWDSKAYSNLEIGAMPDRKPQNGVIVMIRVVEK